MAEPVRNHRTWEFKLRYDRLPADVQRLAEAAFARFLEDPAHPALAVHALNDTSKGQHQDGSISVRVNRQYRAIYVRVDGVNVWYWIGSHSEYDNFTGGK